MKVINFSLLLSVLLLLSCNEDGSNSSEKYLPPSSGTHAEMLIVAHDSLWHTATGEAILNVFAQEQYGLPQPEGIFSVNHVAPSGFQGLLKKAKSLVFFEIGDTTLIQTQIDVWARPQVVTTIIAPNSKTLMRLLKANEAKLVETYHRADLGVVRGRMKSNIYKTLPDGLSDLNINDMYLQLGFEQTLDKPDLKIFKQSTKKTEQFLIFSTRPIIEENLPGQDIIAARDSIGKYYFAGTSDNSYFATETLIPPQQTTTEVDGKFAIETRGMWKTVGDFMGGPFISYTIYNDERNEILTIEGFLYGPDARKRNIILEMEGMITSVKFKN